MTQAAPTSTHAPLGPGPTVERKIATALWNQDERDRIIAMKAYELFCSRGCEHGSDLDDWPSAEREQSSEADDVVIMQSEVGFDISIAEHARQERNFIEHRPHQPSDPVDRSRDEFERTRRQAVNSPSSVSSGADGPGKGGSGLSRRSGLGSPAPRRQCIRTQHTGTRAGTWHVSSPEGNGPEILRPPAAMCSPSPGMRAPADVLAPMQWSKASSS
jgi:hypothetical protein